MIIGQNSTIVKEAAYGEYTSEKNLHVSVIRSYDKSSRH
jgi:hypothetical protein